MQDLKPSLFSRRDELWVTDSSAENPWLKEFHWQSQFQLLKNVDLTTSKDFLFIATHFLPTRGLLISPICNEDHWLRRFKGVWQNFGQPPVKLFLPFSIHQDKLFADWPEAKAIFTVVQETA